jgi:hypothetical protein
MQLCSWFAYHNLSYLEAAENRRVCSQAERLPRSADHGADDRREELEKDRKVFLKSMAEMVPDALEGLTPQERNEV